MTNTLFDALFAPLETRDTPFLILPDGQTISGAVFYGMVARQAHALRGAGVQMGDRVAVQVAKSPEALAAYGAAVALGAIFLPLNLAYTADEVAYFIENATPTVFLCDAARLAELSPVALVHGAKTLTLNADGTGTLSQAAADQPAKIAPAPRGPDDLAAILYTSGTTGRSKGAMLSHQNLLSNAEAWPNFGALGRMMCC